MIEVDLQAAFRGLVIFFCAAPTDIFLRTLCLQTLRREKNENSAGLDSQKTSACIVPNSNASVVQNALFCTQYHAGSDCKAHRGCSKIVLFLVICRFVAQRLLVASKKITAVGDRLCSAASAGNDAARPDKRHHARLAVQPTRKKLVRSLRVC